MTTTTTTTTIDMIQEEPSSFERMRRTFIWKDIRDCPGRSTLSPTNQHLGDLISLLQRVFGSTSQIPTVIGPLRSGVVRDEVFVCKFRDQGGIISYKHPDQTFLHTLNTPEGLSRKLRQLNITLND